MTGSQPQRNMTIHRGARGGAVRGASPRRWDDEPMRLSEMSAILTASQTVLCLLIVGAVFTFQFLSPGLFGTVGDYFQAVMGRAEDPAVEVGVFGRPIDWETVQEYWDRAAFNVAWAAPQRPSYDPFGFAGVSGGSPSEDFSEDPAGGQGGENPWVPENLYLGPVAFSAQASYPAYGKITSPFGPRKHPITGQDDFHTGVDIAGQKGDAIYTVLPGVVEEVGESAIYGNFIKVRHGTGLVTVYCHCDRILAEEGMRLRKGERIAEIGSTGISTGSHLHFEVRVDGNYIDPMRMFVS